MKKFVLVIAFLILVITTMFLAGGKSTGAVVEKPKSLFIGNISDGFGVLLQSLPAKNGFDIIYSKPQNNSLDEIYSTLKTENIFGQMADHLNSYVMLQSNVWIIFNQCGSPEAFYDPQAKAVNICYEFINNMKNFYSSAGVNGKTAAMSNAEFVFYHEVGHALIDALNIPITGREEDVADQFATLMLVSTGKETSMILTAYALGNLQDSATWDEHSLSSQRFYNVLCWLYGQDSKKYENLTNFLPQERAQRCGNEYAKISDSWHRLLQPYLK